MSTTDRILSEFIDAWNAGRRPRAREYLARVPDGPQREELAGQLATWLELAPAPELDDAARDAVRREPAARAVLGDAGALPALVAALRARRGLSPDAVGAELADRLALGAEAGPRAARYVERLERGELAPSRLSRRLLDALGELLGAGGRALAEAARVAEGLRPAAAGGALFRAGAEADEQVMADVEALSRAALTPAPPAMDEVDRLFTGGPDA